MWIGLFPELSEIGGIQQVGREMGSVLLEAARERGLPCELLALNDVRGPNAFWEGPREYQFRGFARNKVALFYRLFELAPQATTLYLGHVNLAPLGWLLRRIHPRLRYWIVAHGVEVWQPLSFARRIALRAANGVFSVSEYTAGQMVNAQKLDPQKVTMLAPALEPAFVHASCHTDVPQFPPQGRILMSVGRLVSSEPGKGIDSVIAVLPEILNAVPDLFYVIVGDGDLRPRLEKLARESPARNRIIFVGKLTVEQLKYCYSRCDVFVMPSHQEGFGVVFLEAMALGKPVIGASVGGTSEIVKDGITGFLVLPGNPQNLVLRVIQLLGDEPLRKRMGEAGRKRFEENYTFARYRKRLLEILKAQG